MKEIKVGEYIKDLEGNITKIKYIMSLSRGIFFYLGEDGYQYNDNLIVKHSFNKEELV